MVDPRTSTRPIESPSFVEGPKEETSESLDERGWQRQLLRREGVECLALKCHLIDEGKGRLWSTDEF